MKDKFSIKERIFSFKHAFNGFKTLLKEEHNARIHLIVAIAVIISGIWFNINQTEWISILLSIALVFSMESINSAIENLSDIISPEWNPLIKKVKDLSAFAVLVCVIIAVIVGVIIFLPKIISLFNY